MGVKAVQPLLTIGHGQVVQQQLLLLGQLEISIVAAVANQGHQHQVFFRSIRASSGWSGA